MNYYENQGGNNPSVYWLQGEVKRGRKPHFSDLAIGLIALQLQYSRTTAIAQRHTQPDTGPEERTSRLPSPGEEAAAAERGDGEASRRRRFFSATRRRRGLGALVVAGAVSVVAFAGLCGSFKRVGACAWIRPHWHLFTAWVDAKASSILRASSQSQRHLPAWSVTWQDTSLRGPGERELAADHHSPAFT